MTVVLWCILMTFLMGILIGALVLRGGSVYPVAFFHGLWKISGYLNITSSGVEGTSLSWMLLSLLTLPLALYGLFLLHYPVQTVDPSTKPLRTEYGVDPVKWTVVGL